MLTEEFTERIVVSTSGQIDQQPHGRHRKKARHELQKWIIAYLVSVLIRTLLSIMFTERPSFNSVHKSRVVIPTDLLICLCLLRVAHELLYVVHAHYLLQLRHGLLTCLEALKHLCLPAGNLHVCKLKETEDQQDGYLSSADDSAD